MSWSGSTLVYQCQSVLRPELPLSGVVDSQEASSFKAKSQVALSLPNLDRSRLILLGARDEQRQQPIIIFSLDGIRVDLHWNH
jgi:hypothetical protein